ncbi:MAG: type II secretion system protein GspL, partial [Pseudomonadota bacterium]|nr:type II secretion system protein GspL [Pseudomonadota bacterium]
MSTLVIQLPEHQRLRARALNEPSVEKARRREYLYVTSDDGIAYDAQGEAAAPLLPRRAQVIAVVRETDVSWHRIVLPKAPASRLRAALAGTLEEALLDEAESVHLAVAPLAVAGQPTWVAAIDRAWLLGELEALQSAGVFVDRVVPMAWPDDPPIGHFHVPSAGQAASASAEGVALSWAHADGVATIRLDGGLARAVLPSPLPATTRWSAAPNASAVA